MGLDSQNSDTSSVRGYSLERSLAMSSSSVRRSAVGSGKQSELQFRIAFVLLLLILAVVSSLIFLTDNQNAVAVPALVTCFLYLLFCVMLGSRVRSGVFGEIGFIFAGFAVAYTVIPALNFLILDFDFPQNFDALNFSALSPRPPEIGSHLWRHCLFIATVIAGYLAGRGRDLDWPVRRLSLAADWRVVAPLLTLILGCVATLSLLSAPVDDYYGHYTRFDSLSWGAKRLAYVCLMLKSGGYYVALALMFANYQKFRYALVAFVAAISAYEMAYSFGSRIETLSILLAVVCLYHFNVRRISLKNGLFYLGGLLILFTVVEFYRTANFDIESALEQFSERGLKVATEFGAVYYTSFHLYFERLNGTIPQHDWRMLINDFFTIVPFYEHTEFNPQYWYAGLYFPEAIVPPQTMGPIAESAIWGGEVDLALRGLFTGLGYGWLARWLLTYRHTLGAIVAYAFLFSGCVIALKYSLAYQVSQMLRTLALAMLLVLVLIETKKRFSKTKILTR